MSLGILVCYVCEASLPKEFSHIHHERPEAAGGTDKDTIYLCSGCHSNVHQITNMLMCSKAPLAQTTISSFSLYANNIPAQQRCMRLAVEAAKWFSLKKSGALKLDPNREVELVIMVPWKLKELLQKEADTLKYPNGRKMGLPYLIKAILREWVHKKYPMIQL